MNRDTLLDRELAEQPAVLRRFLSQHQAELVALGRDLAAGDSHFAVVAARGSSDNAARYFKYLLGVQAGWPVALAAPSLHTRYGASVSYAHAVVLAISQSGRSPDVVAVVDEARRQGRPTVAITNDPESPLAAAADHVVDLGTGPEQSVAATKTYTTSLAAVACLAAGMGGAGSELTDALAAVPDAVATAIATSRDSSRAHEMVAAAPRSFAVGRGYNLSTAYEIALKITELTGSPSQPYSSADLMHGPIAAATPGTPVLVIAPSGRVHEDLADVVATLRDRDAVPIVLSDSPRLLELAAAGVPLPALAEPVSPIVAVVAGQVIAVEAARRRGVPLDTPHGLSKVTETE